MKSSVFTGLRVHRHTYPPHLTFVAKHALATPLAHRMGEGSRVRARGVRSWTLDVGGWTFLSPPPPLEVRISKFNVRCSPTETYGKSRKPMETKNHPNGNMVPHQAPVSNLKSQSIRLWSPHPWLSTFDLGLSTIRRRRRFTLASGRR